MTISILLGKPGSGKTYHATRKIASVLCAWSRKEHAGVIVTNLPLRLDNLDAYVERHTGVKNFVKDHIQLVDENFLRFDRSKLRPGDVTQELRGCRTYEVVDPYSPAYFWNRLPDGAFVVVDEMQKYVGSIKEYGESEKQSLTNYFTQHRHYRHEWIIITQSINTINQTVKECAQTVYEVFNAKNSYMGFPFSIPLRDVDVLLKGFGVEKQVYRVREGSLESSYGIGWEAGVQVVTMTSEIFSLYRTHTLLHSKAEEDVTASLSERADNELPFDLGRGSRWRAIKWFAKRHALHLTVKFCLIFLLIAGIFVFLNFLKDPHRLFNKSTAEVPTLDDTLSLADAAFLPFGLDKEEAREVVEAPEETEEEIVVEDVPEIDFDANEVETEVVKIRPLSIISNEFVGSDNQVYRVGDVCNGELITSIGPRTGVKSVPIEIEIGRILSKTDLYSLFSEIE